MLAAVLAPLGALLPPAALAGQEANDCLRDRQRCGERRGGKQGNTNFPSCKKCCSGRSVKTKKARRCAGRPDGMRCSQDRHCRGGLCRDGSCLAADYIVCPRGCDFDDVHAAVEAAERGRTVYLGANTYGFERTLTIGKDLTLVGAGANKTTLEGDGVRVIDIVAGATVVIRNLTITEGLAQSGSGGGIRNKGNLTLEGVDVADNQAASNPGNNQPTDGGGIYNTGTLALSSFCKVMENSASNGGGIRNDGGSVTLTDTIVTGNAAVEQGGGIATDGGELVFDQCQVADNAAGTNGGGISATDASTKFTGLDGAVADNTAQLDGGGIHVVRGTLTLGPGTFVTRNKATGNTSDGGGIIALFGAAVNIAASDIVVDNKPNNCVIDTGGTIPNCIG
ncbi:MAG TPA: hypothetical protein VFI22_05880 [Thermomicrobiales bacterium]|nr:hypothetical protein [Thermomicrobiales bacterium]